MSDGDRAFEFAEELSIDALPAGSNVLVRGSGEGPALDVALWMVAPDPDSGEGCLIVATEDARDLHDRVTSLARSPDLAKVGVVDCTGGDGDDRFGSRLGSISGPGDLRNVMFEISTMYETLAARGPGGVRIGVFSVDSFVLHSKFREAVRFVHMLTGRVMSTGNLGVFFLDTDVAGEETVDALGHFFDLVVDVRATDDGPELRLDDGKSGGWRRLSARKIEEKGV